MHEHAPDNGALERESIADTLYILKYYNETCNWLFASYLFTTFEPHLRKASRFVLFCNHFCVVLEKHVGNSLVF